MSEDRDMAVELAVPAYEELGFRQTLLGDKETMAYNHAYGTENVVLCSAKKWYSGTLG